MPESAKTAREGFPGRPLPDRDRSREQLARKRFDLLVIGGGIIGAAIGAEAARAGLDVALVERGDFGSATSSASSKLIHGGLRYLRLGDVRLVREAHRERRALMQAVAPHLVRRQPFLLPLYRSGPYGPITVQAGLVLYAALARARLARLVPPERARERVPGLRLEGLRSCGLYADAVTHDSRLCLANVRAAAEAGATVLNYAEVRELGLARGRVVGAEAVVDGNPVSVSARAFVNATGPWVDAVRRLEDPSASPSVRLSKGVHALLALEEHWSAAVTIPHDPVRVSFAVPWQGMLLLGTTDTLYDGQPEEVEATEADLEQILAEAEIALEPRLLRREAIRSTYAGLRVLPGGDSETASARRETVLMRGPAGMLSVAGGKLTTYRRIALDALRALRAELGLHRLDERPRPLPGAVDPVAEAARLGRLHPDLGPSVCAHLAHLYGSMAGEMLAGAKEDPELLQPLHPEGPDLVAQVVYAASSEWACRAEDVLERRTTLAARGLADPELEPRVESLLSLHRGGPAEGLRIRRAKPLEVGAIQDCVRDAYAPYVPRIGREPAPMTADYAELVARNEVWVATEHDAIVGVLVLRPQAVSLLLENVAVAPAMQGRGIGRMLIAFAERHALELGLHEVTLYTNEHMTENLRYYPARGYAEIDRRFEDGFHRVFFRKVLR